MFKKIIIMPLVFFLMLTLNCFATNENDVLAVFNKYVTDANSYSPAVQNYYVSNAKIIRVVNKKQGGQQSVIIPFNRYLKELNSNAVFAKAVNYKNNYVNRKVVKVGENYKVSATRIPRNDKTGLPAYFIFTKQNGTWKIKEESMTTNVQKFLSAK